MLNWTRPAVVVALLGGVAIAQTLSGCKAATYTTEVLAALAALKEAIPFMLKPALDALEEKYNTRDAKMREFINDLLALKRELEGENLALREQLLTAQGLDAEQIRRIEVLTQREALAANDLDTLRNQNLP